MHVPWEFVLSNSSSCVFAHPIRGNPTFGSTKLLQKEIPLGEACRDLLQHAENNIGSSLSTQETEELSDSHPGSGNSL
jgi:hypothetical protein